MITGELLEDLNRIYSGLAGAAGKGKIEHYLRDIGRDRILAFEPHVFTASAEDSFFSVGSRGFMYRRVTPDLSVSTFVTHSGRVPASGFDYYLFNLYIPQEMWFRILDYTEEEQLAHILKWGRHDR